MDGWQETVAIGRRKKVKGKVGIRHFFRSVEIKTDRWMYWMKEGGQGDVSLEGRDNEREEEGPYR